VRTLGILFIVLGQGEGNFEGLMTIQANIIVYGHGRPPINNVERILRLRGDEERICQDYC
jgi:hypothetical protein